MFSMGDYNKSIFELIDHNFSFILLVTKMFVHCFDTIMKCDLKHVSFVSKHMFQFFICLCVSVGTICVMNMKIKSRTPCQFLLR